MPDPSERNLRVRRDDSLPWKSQDQGVEQGGHKKEREEGDQRNQERSPWLNIRESLEWVPGNRENARTSQQRDRANDLPDRDDD